MAAAQPRCCETMLLQRTTSLNIVPQRIAGVLLLCDISQGWPRPAVPACHRRQVFAANHEVAHPGGKGHPPPDIPPLCLEGYGGGRGRLDQGLPAVPEG
jgi:hypothetical protein